MGPDLLIPLAGMFTGVLVMASLAFAGVKIFTGPVGQAIARRINGQAGIDSDTAHEVAELRHQLEQVQQRLADAEERIDFSERLLAQRSESNGGRA